MILRLHHENRHKQLSKTRTLVHARDKSDYTRHSRDKRCVSGGGRSERERKKRRSEDAWSIREEVLINHRELIRRWFVPTTVIYFPLNICSMDERSSILSICQCLPEFIRLFRVCYRCPRDHGVAETTSEQTSRKWSIWDIISIA